MYPATTGDERADMADQPTETVGESLLEVLIAVALTGAVEELFRHWNEQDRRALMIATIAVVVTLINFYHGKVATHLSVGLQRAKLASPIVAMLSLWLNVAVILCLAALAFTAHDVRIWPPLVYVLRTTDCVLVIFTMFIAREAIDVFRAQWIWLAIDLIVMGGFGLGTWLWAGTDPEKLAWLLFGLSAVDIVIDYSANRGLYFSRPSTWSQYHMARLWDELQNEDGIEDSQKLAAEIEHHLEKRSWVWKGKSVLDMGCGNGWLSRRMDRLGASVVGVDQSKSLIDLAQTYPRPDPTRPDRTRPPYSVTYLILDFTAEERCRHGAPFDLIVCFYAIQDCRRIDRAFRFAAASLKAGASMIVVFEDKAHMQKTGRHTMSKRQWLWWGWQLICWRRTPDEDDWERRYVTITRHWGEKRYEREAARNKLTSKRIDTTYEKFRIYEFTKT